MALRMNIAVSRDKTSGNFSLGLPYLIMQSAAQTVEC